MGASTFVSIKLFIDYKLKANQNNEMMFEHIGIVKNEVLPKRRCSISCRLD